MAHYRCDNNGISVYTHHDIEEIENADVTLCNRQAYSHNTSQQYMYVRFHTSAANGMRGFSRAEFTSYGLSIIIRNNCRQI